MLSQERREIDEIDQEIVSLLEKRLTVVNRVAKVKVCNQLEVHDAKREAEVFSKIKSYISKPDYEEIILALYQEMMILSKAYQAKVTKTKK
ncbi:chorismate mutase [Vagococcus intermedius]|uniref:Chorismate mutase n=1 Tax=Vagococcus intermedius TaxID=2991418 RepID=A0AAF0I5Z6_9ENTE|nr:chorismate mutase [Vagococcus intermedius]WEG73273.1 chorismate mutase [Vagococcus intermedius]WEG75355.1 chorismate mutase [Vagococcus intermedius]